MPTGSKRCVLVLGGSGFGRPVSEAVHRPELFCELAGCEGDADATPKLVAAAIAAETASGRIAPDVVVVNQAEDPRVARAARDFAVALRAHGVGAPVLAGSIRDNVYFGESEASADDECLAQAVELSQAKEFVDKLPDGTQHHVAQMGRNMSGGQKQRLSIARALARKPEILVFDDSFSALDYRTDAKLREGLSKQLHDTTKIIVAQRISTIRHADKIIVLDRGETVGIGTHEELMQNCDVYREIATSQFSAAELA